jgi:hypothetical protein
MTYFKSWNFMRLLRLALGAGALVQAIMTSDIIIGILGLVVGGMAFLNVGCYSSGECDTKYKNNNPKKEISDVVFEEVVVK